MVCPSSPSPILNLTPYHSTLPFPSPALSFSLYIYIFSSLTHSLSLSLSLSLAHAHTHAYTHSQMSLTQRWEGGSRTLESYSWIALWVSTHSCTIPCCIIDFPLPALNSTQWLMSTSPSPLSRVLCLLPYHLHLNDRIWHLLSLIPFAPHINIKHLILTFTIAEHIIKQNTRREKVRLMLRLWMRKILTLCYVKKKNTLKPSVLR